MMSYSHETQDPSTHVFAALEDGYEGAFRGHLPIRNEEGIIIDWKDQAEQVSNDWMASFPAGVVSDGNEFMKALIGQDDLFQEPQYDGYQSWPTPGPTSYSEQAWYGHEAPQSGYSSHSWSPPAAPTHHHHAMHAPPPPAQAYPVYPQASYPQYPQYDSPHQHAYWSQPPSYQDE